MQLVGRHITLYPRHDSSKPLAHFVSCKQHNANLRAVIYLVMSSIFVVNLIMVRHAIVKNKRSHIAKTEYIEYLLYSTSYNATPELLNNPVDLV